jgi:gamma-glutamyltranspeptidase/glutathione hydrolase
VSRRIPALFFLVLLATGLTACQRVGRFFFGGPPPGTPGYVIGFMGAVVTDEPRAALEAKEVLSGGGNAADAATVAALTLAVTLPSRAGLGGGGACLDYFPPAAAPEAIVFLPPPSEAAGSDRPAAVPALLRGLVTLEARHGTRPLGSLIAPAEGLARFGVPVSSALARDLKVVGEALLLDPEARRIFGASTGGPLVEGATLTQTDLGSTLAEIRLNGINTFYEGAVAKRLITGSAAAGSPLRAEDLAQVHAEIVAPPAMPSRHGVMVASLPPSADDGATLAAFTRLELDPKDVEAARAVMLAALRTARGNSATLLPATTSFVVLDRRGGAVACALSMGNLFGVGRVAAGTGIVLAASPRAWPRPLLSAAIAWDPKRHAFRAEAASSGQEGAPLATAFALEEVLSMDVGDKKQKAPFMPEKVPEPGRANVIACLRELPGPDKYCHWYADPRLTGLATGGEEKQIQEEFSK